MPNSARPNFYKCVLSSNAMQEMHAKQVAQLAELIQLINGDLSKGDRKKLITLCTIDVHARDVVQRLIDERIESASAFQWQSQLRYSQHPLTKECMVCLFPTLSHVGLKLSPVTLSEHIYRCMPSLVLVGFMLLYKSFGHMGNVSCTGEYMRC